MGRPCPAGRPRCDTPAGQCTAKPWMLCICYCTNSIKIQQLGYLFTARWWILEDLGWFLAKMPRELGLNSTGCFCWILDCVNSQAMDALHLALYHFYQSPQTGWLFSAWWLLWIMRWWLGGWSYIGWITRSI